MPYDDRYHTGEYQRSNNPGEGRNDSLRRESYHREGTPLNYESQARLRTNISIRSQPSRQYEHARRSQSYNSRYRSQTRKYTTPIWKLVVMDVSFICASLLVFAYFHHVRPVKGIQSGMILPRITEVPSAMPMEPVVTAEVTESPIATEEPITPDTNESGMWGAKFKDEFTMGDVIRTENSYQSENIHIRIDKVQRDDMTYYVADIHLRDITNFKTAFADDTFGRNRDATVSIANNHNAILALSGDYCGMREEGLVIRNGELFRESTDSMDVLVMYYDGTMQAFSPGQVDLNKLKTEGAYQAWNFGPMLLKDGQVMTEFNSNLRRKNPRSAIGYYEPGHYCFVMIDGRQEGYSVGMTLAEMSQMFYELGCKVAYNLDGGQSAVMAFDGKVHNQPYDGGRSISDIVYIAE